MDELTFFYKNALMGSLCDPLCNEYKSLWRACGKDKERLVRLSVSQQAIPYFATYCNKGLGLSKKFLLDTFKGYINGYTINDADNVRGYTYGLYVSPQSESDDGEINVDKDISHFMFTKDVTLIVSRTKCPTIYVSNGSNVRLICDGYNSVRLYLFDDSRVEVEDAGRECTVTAYLYSQESDVTLGAYAFVDVKKFRKKLKL